MINQARLSLFAVLASMAMVVLDAGMLSVALPALSTALAVDPADGIWVITSYQMALLAGLLPSAQLAERFGQRRALLVGLAIYLGASICSALAPSLAVLVAARIVQGLGGAAIMALGISILRIALGPDKLGRAIGWNALIVALSSAAAPSIAAIVLSVSSWPWLFLAKLPIGFAALAAATRLHEDPGTRKSVEWTAIALHVSAAVALLVAIERAPDQPITALCSLAILAALIRRMIARQSVSEAPLWPLDLMAHRVFRTSVIASVACFVGQTAGLIAMPLMLQLGASQSVGNAALVMTCWPVAAALAAFISGRLAQRFRSSVLCSAGATTLGIGLLIGGLAAPAGGLAIYAVAALISGTGFGLFQVANNRSLFLSPPTARGAAAGGMQGSARLMGQSFGALLLGLLLDYYPGADAALFALVIGGLCAMGASLVSMNPHLRSVQRRHA